MDLTAFAAEVGADGPVVPVGSRTQWDVGGAPDPDAREVKAPSGIVAYEPAEMTVRVRAGTTMAELDAALTEHGQMVPLDPRSADATVGGVLAVGQSGLRRLRYGPVRDTLLEARFVTADGRLVKAGGPVVKNVSGFDLCRLLVGSLGTIGVLAEVVLRVQPTPKASKWYRREGLVDHRTLHRPSAVLWDGGTSWVLLEGHPVDIALGWDEVEGPPALPRYRRSLRPSKLPMLTGRFVAELGVGTVHLHDPPPLAAPDRPDLHARVKELFDPTGRLNPGRRVA
ncbi:MAG TPA: FAD-binding protein [Acidimicrobiales bacterium]|nr:FAD-binding protein [Acidimicrobiales bacterium]